MRPSRPLVLQARVLFLLAMLLVIAGCSEGKAPPQSLPHEASGSEPAATPARPSTLDDVIRRTHFAFRREGGLWTGGHTTYAVRVSERELRVTPHLGEKAGAELELRTEAVSRGATSLVSGTATSATDAEGKLRIQRGGVVERLENTDDGVEQSWAFDTRPAGQGDLKVTIRVAGQDYKGETAHGHHFADPDTGLGIRYGRATWIDARGEKTDVPVSYADGALALTVPAAIVDKSAYPAVLDPTIGPEVGMDDPVLVPARNDQLQPAVAYGTNQFLVVWTDYRAAGSPSSEIYGVRVKSDGTVLDTTGIPISRGAGLRDTPAVAFDGTNWMVIWRDTRTTSSGDIYGTRISQEGVVLNTNGFPIATNGSKTYPAIAYDGTNYLVVFRQSNVVQGVRLAPTGVVLSASPFTIIPEAASYAPAVAHNGTHFLVAGGGRYRRVANDGTVVDTSSKTFGTDYDTVGVASDGSGWVIAYKTYSSSYYYLYAMRVAADGSSLGQTNIAYISSSSTAFRASYGGGAYVLAFADGNYVYGARVNSTTGAVLNGSTTMLSTPDIATQPAIAIGGSTLFVAFRNSKLSDSNNPADVFGRRFTASTLAAIDASSVLLSRAANQQFNTAVAFNGTNYLVAWQDERNGLLTSIYGARLNQAGEILDPDGIRISQAANAQKSPAIASNGSEWFVAWQDARPGNNQDDIYGTRVGADGSVKDILGIQISTGTSASGLQQTPAVASDGTDYLVAWTTSSRIYGARVKASNGDVPDANGFPISSTTSNVPSVAYGNQDYLVVWNASNNVHGARVSKNGQLLDATAVVIAEDGVQTATPTVAFDGTNWLVAWQANKVRAARVSTAGAVLDSAFDISTSGGAPKLAWDGGQYWAAWQSSGSNPAVHAARISPAKVVKDASPLVIATDPLGAFTPAIAAGTSKKVLIAYHRYDHTQPSGATRVRAKIVDDLLPNGSACVQANECASGSCVDGVCCESACSGTCQACSAAKKGSGVDGTCGPVKAGTDPNDSCQDLGASSCGTNGVCDGAGACQLYTSGTSCGNASCSGNSAIQPKCNGTGTCVTPPTGTDCGLYACSAGTCKQPCAGDGDCVTGNFCQSGTCKAKQANGATCTAASQCTSGFCADGVCCDTACGGTCQACSAAKKGSGANGTCGPVKVGTDPNNQCADQGASSCGTNGMCDGAGACQLYASGTTCGAAVCSGTQAKQPVCNGSGTCQTPATGTECAPYACSAGACKQPCSTDNDCATGNFCQTGVCKPKQAAGTACTTGNQCALGFCVDGVCCDSACGGTCQACSAVKKGSGTDGMCGPVKAGTDPNNQCADQGVASCGQNGMCNGAGACQVYASGTPCGGTCSGNSAEGKVCNGSGSCVSASGSTDCAPFACSGGTCKTSCATVNDCAAGFQCVSGTCKNVRNNGEACTDSGQCLSNFCVDGVCCNSACTGLCQACSTAKKGSGADGACGPIGANRDPDDECAEQAATSCGTTGMCNGSGACQLHPSGTTCGSPICQGTVLKTPNCNGSGTCTTPATGQDCFPYACSGGACKATCTSNGDCASGRVCVSGACIAPLANAAPCTAGTQCQSGQCVDGVCCDKACAGGCEACTASKKGSGSDGTCGPIAAGTDPDEECDSELEATCGRNGFCDGKGACQLHAAGTSCGTSSCQGNSVQGRVCDGKGVCGTSQGLACAPYVCSGGTCKNPCANSNECQAGNFCQAGVCKPLGANGTPCSQKGECQSGYCVDGVCCNAACTSKCMACSAAIKGQGSDGTCDPIRVGTDPDNECAAQAPSTCGFDGFCDGQGDCGRYAAGTTCQAAGCDGNEQTSASICDGTGTCVAGTTTVCVEGYACVNGACATYCEDDTACDTGYRCDLTFQGCVIRDDLPDGGTDAGPDADTDADVDSDAGDEDGGQDDVDAGDEVDAGEFDGDVEADDLPWEVETDSGGCGCRVAGSESPRGPMGAGALLALGAVVIARRRRASAGVGRR